MSLIPTSLSPLYPSLTAPRGPKRTRSLAKGSSLKARRRVHFFEGSAVTGTLDGSDGSEADRLGRTGASRDGTSGAVQSSGVDRTPELSSDIFASLLSADDPLMQQLGLHLSAQQVKNNDPRHA